MVGGVLAGIIGLMVGVNADTVVWVGVIGAVVVFAVLLVTTLASVPRDQATMESRFPAPEND